MLTNFREQLTRTKGFRHVVIAASRPCLLLFAAERVRSDSNDWDRAQRWIGFNAARGCITVHDRELDIHQDKVGPLLYYRGKRLLAVFDFGNLIVCRGQHVADDLAIIRLVACSKLVQKCKLTQNVRPKSLKSKTALKGSV